MSVYDALKIKNWTAPWWPSLMEYHKKYKIVKVIRPRRVYFKNRRFWWQLAGYVRRLKKIKYYELNKSRLKYQRPPLRAFPPWFRRSKYQPATRKVVKYGDESTPIPRTPKTISQMASFSGRWRYVFSRYYAPRARKIDTTRHLVRFKPAINNVFVSLTGRDRTLARRAPKNTPYNKLAFRKSKPDRIVGRTLKLLSTGLVGYKGPKRSSNVAAEDVGRFMSYELRRRKIKKFIAVLHCGKDKRVYAALKSLLNRRVKLQASSYILRPSLPHSKGLRKQKQRRS